MLCSDVFSLCNVFRLMHKSVLLIIEYTVVPTQVEKMRAELANLNHCAVPFLSRAAVSLSWYDSTVRPLSSAVLGQSRF